MYINNRMAVVIPNYLREILSLCEEYDREYFELEEMINVRDAIYVNNYIFPKLNTLVLHAANINKLIFPPKKNRKEEKWRSDFRNERIQCIAQYYDEKCLIEIRNTELRNSLEHYDERMDKFFYKFLNDRDILIEDSSIEEIIFNTTFLRRTYDTKRVFLLKCFIISEMTYVNAGAELNLNKINSEIIYLKQKIEMALNDPILFEPSHSISLKARSN